jgi:hypothetical protein
MRATTGVRMAKMPLYFLQNGDIERSRATLGALLQGDLHGCEEESCEEEGEEALSATPASSL